MDLLIASSLRNLASTVAFQGRLREAEPLYRRALAITEQNLGAVSFEAAQIEADLAVLSSRTGKPDDAAEAFLRAIPVLERRLGKSAIQLAPLLDAYAAVLRKNGRKAQARELSSRANSIRALNANYNRRGLTVDVKSALAHSPLDQ
jgi:tetratricopeptide (TPR) repeat protein